MLQWCIELGLTRHSVSMSKAAAHSQVLPMSHVSGKKPSGCSHWLLQGSLEIIYIPRVHRNDMDFEGLWKIGHPTTICICWLMLGSISFEYYNNCVVGTSRQITANIHSSSFLFFYCPVPNFEEQGQHALTSLTVCVLAKISFLFYLIVSCVISWSKDFMLNPEVHL